MYIYQGFFVLSLLNYSIDGLSIYEGCSKEPGIVGNCRTYQIRWSFVKAFGCYSFNWGGCGGSWNTFKSKSECESLCIRRQFIAPVSSLMSVPRLKLEYSFKTTKKPYTSSTFTISDGIVYVLSETAPEKLHVDKGNKIIKYDLKGKFLGNHPGRWDHAIDIIIGGRDKKQVLVSMIRPHGKKTGIHGYNMDLYNKSGKLFKGLEEEESGIVSPSGMAYLPGSNKVVVCDFAGDKIKIMDLDWEKGTVNSVKDLIKLKTPSLITIADEKIIAVHVRKKSLTLQQISVFDMKGKRLHTIKKIPGGKDILDAYALAVDPFENILLSFIYGSPAIVFSSKAKIIGKLPILKMPMKMVFNDGKLFVLYKHVMKVYTYSL